MSSRNVTDARSTLFRLSEVSLTISDPAEDVRGRKVLDADGEEVGEVDDLIVDDQEHLVRFLQVSSGGLWGLGESTFLVPVDAVSSIDDEHVHIDQTRTRVAGAPRYDPDLTDENFYDEVYGYYGYTPFWGLGYAYPGYPYFL